jgi:MYXO-CTERM domain-containing protein/uncharacterized repeat protein (TIGR01451 family)
MPISTVCRGAVLGADGSTCDVAEHCDGTTPVCPGDHKAPVGSTCRAAADLCDVPATCDGMTNACPPNTFRSATSLCRAAADLCDLPAYCTGGVAACPANGFKSATTECHEATGVCDMPALCTGSAAACPPNPFKPPTTICRPALDPTCDIQETCTGSSPDCPLDQVQPSGHICRPAGGVCDIAEVCNGTSGSCPGDVKIPAGVVCRNPKNDCDIAEVCDGAADACPMDRSAPDNAVCSAGTCQAASCRAESDIVVAAAASPAYDAPRSDLSYTIGVGNIGRSPSVNVVVDITVPAGTRLIKSTGNLFPCQAKNDTTIECRRVGLSVGENELITLSLIPPDGANELDLTATATSDVFDPVTTNNSASVSQSLVTDRFAGGGTGCSVAPASAPGASFTWLLGLFGLAGLVWFRRRRSS